MDLQILLSTETLSVNLTNVNYLPFMSLLQDVYDDPRVDEKTKYYASLGLMLARNKGAVNSKRYQSNKRQLIEKDRNTDIFYTFQKVILFAGTSVMWCFARHAINPRLMQPFTVTLSRTMVSTIAATCTSLIFLERDLPIEHRPEYSVALLWIAAVSQVLLLNARVNYILVPYFLNAIWNGKYSYIYIYNMKLLTIDRYVSFQYGY